jgi:L-asparaginase
MKIKIFTTGGSIDKNYSTRASDFIVGEPHIEDVLSDANANLDYEVEFLFAKDSLEITDADRKRIVEKVRAETCPRIVITHGTDTMIQTANALSNIPGKIIVLTGAMQPAAFKHTDADFNVGGAVIAVQTLPPGVYLVMNGRVFDPKRSRKNLEANQFESVE